MHCGHGLQQYGRWHGHPTIYISGLSQCDAKEMWTPIIELVLSTLRLTAWHHGILSTSSLDSTVWKMVSAFAASLATSCFIEVWSDSFWSIMSTLMITGFILFTHFVQYQDWKEELYNVLQDSHVNVAPWLYLQWHWSLFSQMHTTCQFCYQKKLSWTKSDELSPGASYAAQEVIITITSAQITSSLVDDSWKNFETDA